MSRPAIIRKPVTTRKLGAGEEPPPISPRRYKTANGYIKLRWWEAPHCFIECLEHRFLMGNPDGLHVHHKNGIRDDNRLENLELLTPRQHSRQHLIKILLDPALVVSLYREGKSTVMIAAELGSSSGTVCNVLRQVGEPTRDRSSALALAYRRGRRDRE